MSGPKVQLTISNKGKLRKLDVTGSALQEMLKIIFRLREMSIYGNYDLQEERKNTRNGKRG